MSDSKLTREEEINTLEISRPHIVILGAGASRATCPEGDSNNKRLPVIGDLIDIVGLAELFKQEGIDQSQENFEKIYSDLCVDKKYSEFKNSIEFSIFQYFRELSLPENPTVYDYLVLSLRSKDIIATFNWDPLLFQAYVRNRCIGEMPTVLYLHGCCAIGYCPTDKIQDEIGELCPFCDKNLIPTPLLFPVTNKDYISDPYIADQWETLTFNLKHAFILTIFGYGAPETDIAAVELMNEAWGDPEKRFLETIEIIDILNNHELRQRWKKFIHTHHYLTTNSFFESLLAKHPRRSCDALSQTVRYGRYREGNPFPMFSRLEELWEWLQPLLSVEENEDA